MKEYVILLDDKYKDRLTTVRTVPGWKAAADGKQIWLRGPLYNGDEQPALNSLPAKAWYLMDEEFRLFPRGKQTPVLTLKELGWQSLTDFIPVTFPVSAMPGEKPGKIKICLLRSGNARPAFALLATMAAWKYYVEGAPLIRLAQLRFAVSANGYVLITGHPLPAVKGASFWLCKNILVPSGYELDPPLLSDLVSRDDLLLFYPDGRMQTIPSSCFNPAERSLIRQNG